MLADKAVYITEGDGGWGDVPDQENSIFAQIPINPGDVVFYTFSSTANSLDHAAMVVGLNETGNWLVIDQSGAIAPPHQINHSVDVSIVNIYVGQQR